MENKDGEKNEGVGFFDNVGNMIKSGIEKRKGDSFAIYFDLTVLAVAFLFSGTHIAFGAYPLGVAFVAALPHGVWGALLGAVLGALSLGRLGIIHAIIAVIVVFMRIIISGGERRGEVNVFKEPLVLRISAAAIGAFVGGVYEILLGGLSAGPLLYAAFSVASAAVFTFAFSGIFDAGISLQDFLTCRRNIFAGRKSEKEKTSLYIFEATFLLYVFLISLSLRGYDILGVSPAYIFSGFMTLIVARRFGAIRGLTVGFISTLAVSSVYSVAFALVGLGAGLLFSFGAAYAFIGSGFLLSAWSMYAGGVMGFLSTFPEYVSAALLVAPLIRKMPSENISAASVTEPKDAQDMVSATALAYKNSDGSAVEALEEMLSEVSKSIKTLGAGENKITLSEYRDSSVEAVREFCRDCPCYSACVAEHPAPCVENIDAIATKLYKKERLFSDDSTICPKYCHNAVPLFEHILDSAAALEAEKFKSRKIEAIGEDYSLFSRLVSEARANDRRERCQNTALSEKLTEVFERAGLHGGVIKAFGERRKYFIGAGEDKDGSLVTSPELHSGIEEAAGVKLAVPEYYRKGDIALFECASMPMYSVEFAAASKHASAEDISGDTAISFESRDGHFYSLISDGMGSGESAHKTSHFAADFLSRILDSPISKSTAFHILNHVIKNRAEECSTTVDLFDFDLLTGEALFYKCGAAPSYVKRENSLFRIRSETAPIGLISGIDAEKIRVEVLPGDYVIMLSDGVSQTQEDSAWLLELLSTPPPADIRAYAERILSEAGKHSKSGDDMSVSVAKIIKI